MKNTFDYQQLRVFASVARHLSLRRAAAEMEMTASGISRCLAGMERQWGCRLFDRSSRRVMLSKAGREFLPMVTGILEQLGLLEQRLRSREEPRPGQLRVGAASAISHLILPSALREFREACPHLKIQITLCNAPQASQSLASDELDLAVTVEPASIDGCTFAALAEEDLHFVVHPLHPWAVERRVHPNELSQRRLILPDRRDETFALVESYFREDGLSIEPLFEIASEELIKQCILLDLGVGVLPRWMIAPEIAAGRLTTLPLGRRRLKRRWGILQRRGRNPDFGEHLFANICGAVLRDRIAGHA